MPTMPPPPRPPLNARQRSDLTEQHLNIGRTGGGRAALVNNTLADRGVTSTAAPGVVTLTWKPYAADARYTVVRGETPLTTTKPGQATFKDTTATAGASYQYRIIPQLKGDTSAARTWGLTVAVPKVKHGEAEAAAVQRTAVAQAKAAKASATTTLTWTTFIPDKYINQPIPKACKYWGTKYVYGGDNRGFDWKSSRYRTSESAVITWKNRKVSGYTSVKATHVYRKSNHKLVAQKTASAKDMKVKKLGSGSGYVDIRMVTHATNPFCGGIAKVKGAIDGALTFHITRGGWEIRSGNHRRMPNHEIYIYNGGRVTWVYKSKYASPLCLVGALLCDLRNLTGYYGKYK
ncbi:hypothetical protein LK07_15940 [Streptomyces pluripotens]|uniref:Uncharacterized protein n=1 Tax=Streptomyces pluripotens TaxID=1355015 RepID=A0A221NZ75_9ACTN|nr:hypothetical protein [Streptomyces pluripotens]ARP71018.1 hypothetical protein LK06_014805 [Streptomyces pluripotens]ASN25270.1 hypothetical protein LK07_15940 [Streptomyces pluripotens]